MGKAKTKSDKVRQKRGRSKMIGAPREPNGRISRSGIDHGSADIIALESRARRTGLSLGQAKDQKAGTFIGCLNLIGARDGLSDDQYNAAVAYRDLRESYLRAIKAPNAIVDNHIPGSAGDEVSDGYIEWSKAVRDRYSECQKMLIKAQQENRTENLYAALDYAVVRDERYHYMLGALRIACNHLARFFRT